MFRIDIKGYIERIGDCKGIQYIVGNYIIDRDT
jgi:hypothetical protein